VVDLLPRHPKVGGSNHAFGHRERENDEREKKTLKKRIGPIYILMHSPLDLSRLRATYSSPNGRHDIQYKDMTLVSLF
jgi:hypothetical protein